MADISKINLPNGTVYDLKDANALPASAVSTTGTSGAVEGWYECKIDGGLVKYYNTDSNVLQQYTSTDTNRPLLMAAGDNQSSSAHTSNTYIINTVYANPSTGVITANDFQIPTSTGAYYVSELTDILKDILPDGVANRFELDANVTQAAYQMQLTRLSASSFHITGTASGQWDKKVGTITLHPGTWKMQANIDGGQNNFYFYAQGTSPTWRTNSTQSLSAAVITIDTETTFNIYLRLASGYTVDMDVRLGIGLYREQILLGASGSMVDHALTNSELTDAAAGLVDKGAKNLSPVNDVTFTRPVGAAYTEPIFIDLAAGEYVIRYKLTTTANSAVAITYDGSEHTFYDSSAPYSDTVITHNFTVASRGTSFRFYFNQAATVSELMICSKADWDTSYNYQPYALDNPTLTYVSGSLVDRGAKNLAWPIGTTSSANNASFTAYADGSFGIKTTAATSAVTFYYCSRVTVKPGTYVLSGGISSVVKLYDGDAWSSEGSPSIKTFAEETTFRLYIRVNNGYNNQTEVIVKPMVCTLEDFQLSSEYKAFSLNNPELTSLSRDLADRGAKNLANYTVWRDNVSVNRGTKSVASNGAITITATGSDCYTDQTFSSDALLPCRIPVIPGQTYVATWTSTNTGSGNKYFYMFPNGSSTGAIAAKSSDLMCLFTAPADCTYLTWRISCSTSGDSVSYNNFMICTLEAWKASSAYQSYGMSNSDLTEHLATVEDKLTLLKSAATTSNVTTLTQVSGVTLDIPASSGYWELFAVVRMSSAAPQILEVRATQDSSGTEYLICRTDVTGTTPNSLFLTCRSVIDATSYNHVHHLKVYVKMASTATGTPRVSLIARRLGS